MIEHSFSLFICTTWLLGSMLGASTVSAREDGGITEARAMLASGDHDRVEAGIQSLGLIGTADAVPPLTQRIRDGLPPDLLDTAILTDRKSVV